MSTLWVPPTKMDVLSEDCTFESSSYSCRNMDGILRENGQKALGRNNRVTYSTLFKRRRRVEGQPCDTSMFTFPCRGFRNLEVSSFVFAGRLISRFKLWLRAAGSYLCYVISLARPSRSEAKTITLSLVQSTIGGAVLNGILRSRVSHPIEVYDRCNR